jgi:hypothetical protein
MIDISQNNQSMKMGQIKRVRFNLESNRTIYFSKHTRIKLGLSRMPTIEESFCRWGDIDPATETGVSLMQGQFTPRRPSRQSRENTMLGQSASSSTTLKDALLHSYPQNKKDSS